MSMEQTYSACLCEHAWLLQSCPTLCNPTAHSLPGSSVLGFSRQESWSGLPFPPPGDLSDPGREPTSVRSPAWIGGFFTISTTWEALNLFYSPKILP